MIGRVPHQIERLGLSWPPLQVFDVDGDRRVIPIPKHGDDTLERGSFEDVNDVAEVTGLAIADACSGREVKIWT
jgi:hypothetical protein